LVYNDTQIDQILDLQKRNLTQNISQAEFKSEGFVSVEHTKELLLDMCLPYPHVIALDENKVVAYALMMSIEFSKKIPMLVDLFQRIEQLDYKGFSLAQAKYMVMGQICIDKPYRSKGIFQKLYLKMSDTLKAEYDFIITEISLKNGRSMRAHEKVGFKSILEYTSSDNIDWSLVIKEIK